MTLKWLANKIDDFSLREFHVAHQFLDAADIASLFTRTWSADTAPSTGHLKRERSQDLFTANMIMAIGAVGMFRAGRTSFHPFGFFTAALSASPPSEFSFGAIQDVENLLLIAYFGIFFNIGTPATSRLGFGSLTLT